MNRVVFLVDGFNVYHSLDEILRKRAKRPEVGSIKWLDIRSLANSYMSAIGRDASLEKVYYFSALATHLEALKPDVTARHRLYLQCLKDSGVEVELSRFKRKTVFCPYCRKNFDRYEEKESDVSIAVRMMEVCSLDLCDTIVLVTGDTDLIPAIRCVKKLFPEKEALCAFPYNRYNNELAKIVSRYFKINFRKISKHQFPDPYVCRNGVELHKPIGW